MSYHVSNEQVVTTTFSNINGGDKIFHEGEFPEIEMIQGKKGEDKEYFFLSTQDQPLIKEPHQEVIKLKEDQYDIQTETLILDGKGPNHITERVLRTAEIFGWARWSVDSSELALISVEEIAQICYAVGYRLIREDLYDTHFVQWNNSKNCVKDGAWEGEYTLLTNPSEVEVDWY